jgi:5-methylcytosine-specific restriction endonuclease McrA
MSWGGSGVAKLTAMVKAEYGYLCHLCLKEITDESNYTVDHVIPRSKGGDNSIENLRPAHGTPCNYSRGNRSIEEYRASRTDETGWFFQLG